MNDRIILSLFDHSGEWSRPYAEAGYRVIRVCLPERDVRTFEPPRHVHGVLSAPPCTEFAVSGARWWRDKPPEVLDDALSLVDCTLEIIRWTCPKWWALENPVGRLRKLRPELGRPLLTFDPADFGDGYTKRTHLWGRFKPPTFTAKRGDAPLGSKMHLIPPGPRQQELRSITPPGFARAFFAANP